MGTKTHQALAVTHPALVAEWDYEKNDGLLPEMVSAGSGKRVWWKCRSGHEWKTAVYHRKAGHGCPCCAASHSAVHPGMNDLKTLESWLAAQWDYEKNQYLSPDGITRYSQKKVWWKCEHGHSFLAGVARRMAGRGCPYCAGQKVLRGYNDLATVRPDLAGQWDYEKNKPLLPGDITAGADRKVWWKCGQGHEWQAVIYSRKNGCGCPYCAGNAVLPGFNDLPTLKPELLEEWDFVKNKDISPTETAPNTNRRVWWICKQNHSWQAAISSRAQGKGCPYCTGRKVLAGFNDLETKMPELIAEWDWEKNGTLKPDEITAFSKRKVWWIDVHGHSWLATASNRSLGCGCPYCAGRKVLPGFNDLATQNPELAMEWDSIQNGDLAPEMVTVQSHRSVWWKCSRGHSWQSSISNRNHNGCPVCSNRKVSIGFNDLKTIHQELAGEWDYCRNGGLLPEKVTYGTSRKVWWKCKEGHSWKGTVYSRHKGGGCPVCAMKKDHHPVTPGTNDLLAVSPALAAEWDAERNGALAPDQVMPYSTKKVWWVCKKGHHWRARIQARQKGTGCPYCSGHITHRSQIVT